MKEPDISIKKLVSVKVLKHSTLGMRRCAAMVAGGLINEIWVEFERLENEGAEFEYLELTATFRRGEGGSE